MNKIDVLHEGKYLGLYKRGTWEFTQRPNSDACVGILPITPEGEIVLIEQFRVPTQSRVIEIPAGLVGDEPKFAGEDLAETAKRELIEETGYSAATMTLLIASPTSAGMTPERTYLFAATGLTKVGEGGGVAGEDITVHHVPFTEINNFLDEKAAAGYDIDFKIHASLYLAQSKGLP